MKTPAKNPPAYSLIFAFLVMTVLMIVASSTVERTRSGLASQRELEGPARAKDAADSAAETAILAMKDHGAGYSIDLVQDAFTWDEDGDGTEENWGDYTVYSSAQENDNEGDGYFYSPIPGTGTAGENCSVRDSDHDGDFDADLPADDPCNWNRLLYGDTVSIPLYRETPFGILTAADFATFTSWSLKVRTPCMDGSENVDCIRYEFDGDGSDLDGDGEITDDDSSVVFWQLIGEETDGDIVTTLPNDETTPNFRTYLDERDLASNSEIYESLINEAYLDEDFIVLSGVNEDPYKEIYEVCTATDLSTLSLQLNIVTPLVDSSDNPIPYLEWQLVTDASEPFGDTKAVIKGEGYFKGKDGTFYHSSVITRSTTDESATIYTLSN